MLRMTHKTLKGVNCKGFTVKFQKSISKFLTRSEIKTLKINYLQCE